MGDVGRLLSLGSFLGMGACTHTIAIVYTVSSVVWLDNNVLLVQYERFAIQNLICCLCVASGSEDRSSARASA